MECNKANKQFFLQLIEAFLKEQNMKKKNICFTKFLFPCSGRYCADPPTPTPLFPLSWCFVHWLTWACSPTSSWKLNWAWMLHRRPVERPLLKKYKSVVAPFSPEKKKEKKRTYYFSLVNSFFLIYWLTNEWTHVFPYLSQAVNSSRLCRMFSETKSIIECSDEQNMRISLIMKTFLLLALICRIWW